MVEKSGPGWGQDQLLVRAAVLQIEWQQKQFAAGHTQCPTPNSDSLNRVAWEFAFLVSFPVVLRLLVRGLRFEKPWVGGSQCLWAKPLAALWAPHSSQCLLPL